MYDESLFNIKYDATHGCVDVLFYDENIGLLFPYITRAILDRYNNGVCTIDTINCMKSDLDSFFNGLVKDRYLERTGDNTWLLDIISFVMDNIGKQISLNPSLYKDTDILAKCLVKHDGTLCDQARRLPAAKIEDICLFFKNKELNYAVEMFKDEMILDVAGISGE